MLALAAVFLGAPAAHAASGTMWFDAQTGRCLSSNTGGGIYTDSYCPAGTYPLELWNFTYNSSDGSYSFYNTGIRRCLDSNASGSVYSNPCSAANGYQHWRLLWNNGDTSYNLQDVATGRCLDSNTSGSIYTNPCQRPNGYQHWQYI
jgi:serine/threonine-protein kinase